VRSIRRPRVTTEDECGERLWNAYSANGYVAVHGVVDFRNTFQSGWRAGLQRPEPDPSERLTGKIIFNGNRA
jgi:hypothetical protein